MAQHYYKKEAIVIVSFFIICVLFFDVKNIYESEENGKSLLPVLDAMAFLHFGISLMFRISADKTSNFKEELKGTNCIEIKPLFHTKETKCLNTCLHAAKAMEKTMDELGIKSVL